MKQFEFASTLRPSNSAGNMQPMVDNLTPSDAMPNWQTPPASTFNSSAANNHGFSPKGNGVGGATGTHAGHDAMVADLTTAGDDKSGYGAA